MKSLISSLFLKFCLIGLAFIAFSGLMGSYTNVLAVTQPCWTRNGDTDQVDPATKGDCVILPVSGALSGQYNTCPGGYLPSSDGTTCRINAGSAAVETANGSALPGQLAPSTSACSTVGAAAVFQILPYCNLFDLLDAIRSFLLSLATPIAVLVIMYGGYQYFLGSFDSKANGMKTIQAGVIGLALVLTAPYIIDIVKNTFTNQGIKQDAINAAIVQLYTQLITLAQVVAVLTIVYGGYQYFFGGFNSKADGAKTIQNGVIGLAVVTLAKVIADFVVNIVKGKSLAELPASFVEQFKPILSNFTTSLTFLAGAISVLVIIWGGYQYFFSGLTNGKRDGLDAIRNGVIGLVVTILAGPIVGIVNSTIGVQNNQLALNTKSIIYIFQQLISNFLIPISAVVTVFFLILGAYQWITAGGDVGKVKKGQDNIRNALIGLIVVLLATTISQLVIYFVKPTDYIQPGSGTTSAPQSTTSGSTSTGTTTRPSLSTNK